MMIRNKNFQGAGALFFVFALVAFCGAGWSAEFASEQYTREVDALDGSKMEESGLSVKLDGKEWFRTVATPLDENHREETYKVYTQILDFEGEEPITKGAGGKYTHHRGLFIGWKDTLLGDNDFDTWHMPNCSQEHFAWVSFADPVFPTEVIHWKNEDGKPFLVENRRVVAREGEDGVRIFDFETGLSALAGDLQLRGDLQHAGMQIRMANEVSEHPDSTRYVLPEGAETLDDDKVVGAWWACGSVVVRDKRYWVLHMTPQDHPTGEPVYSIRDYARFGAFFEPDLKKGRALNLRFRVVVSEKELDGKACEALYEAYNKKEETK